MLSWLYVVEELRVKKKEIFSTPYFIMNHPLTSVCNDFSFDLSVDFHIEA